MADWQRFSYSIPMQKLQQKCRHEEVQRVKRERTLADYKHSQLLTRTAWVDSGVAYNEIQRNRATGNTCALCVRSRCQNIFGRIGYFSAVYCFKVLFIGLAALSVCSVGLKMVHIEADVEKLWIEDTAVLRKEREYTERFLENLTETGISSQVVVQVNDRAAAKSRESLLMHLEAVQELASSKMFFLNSHWSLDDFCLKPSFPELDDQVVDNVIQKIVPCTIITPLDCFWEGAKTRGPHNAVFIPTIGRIHWDTLNPGELLNRTLKHFGQNREYRRLRSRVNSLMQKTGIDSGYMNRPCLNLSDQNCPSRQLHIKSTKYVLSQGCSGFANRLQRWPEHLMFNGEDALQTVIYLASANDVYEMFRDTYFVHTVPWSRRTALQLLRAWQNHSAGVLERFSQRRAGALAKTGDRVFYFSPLQFEQEMNRFSEPETLPLVLAAIFIFVYAILCGFRRTEAHVKTTMSIGAGCICVMVLSVSGALGVTAVLRIPFTFLSLKVLPIKMFVLFANSVFFVYAAVSELEPLESLVSAPELVSRLQKRCAPSLAISLIAMASCEAIPAFTRVPIITASVIQSVILVGFHLVVVLLLFPAVVAADMWRRSHNRIDLLCCWKSDSRPICDSLPNESLATPSNVSKSWSVSVTGGSSSKTKVIASLLAPNTQAESSGKLLQIEAATKPAAGPLAAMKRLRKRLQRQSSLSVDKKNSCWPTRSIDRLLKSRWARVIICVVLVLCVTASAFGCWRLKQGLTQRDILSSGSKLAEFFDARQKYFDFYESYIVTKHFDYASPTGQKLLRDMHNELRKNLHVMTCSNATGEIPLAGCGQLWLDVFRDWLLRLQDELEHSWQLGLIDRKGWSVNASDEAVLAYKLLVQTGDPNRPNDRARLLSHRLVRPEGIISPDAFYLYLTAWKSLDPFAYDASQANIVPSPNHYKFDRKRGDLDGLHIPRSKEIQFANIHFVLHNMSSSQLIDTVSSIRHLSQRFASLGLPNYPSGHVFTFGQQYLYLTHELWIMLGISLAVLLLLFVVFWFNLLASLIIVFSAVFVLCCSVGLLTCIGVKLNALSAQLMCSIVGGLAEPLGYMLTVFLTGQGDRPSRARLAIRWSGTPLTHSFITTAGGLLFLLFCRSDFINRYYVWAFLISTTIGYIYTMVVLPTVLSLIGPNAFLLLPENGTSIAPPTPPESPTPVASLQRGSLAIQHHLTTERCDCTNCSPPTTTTSWRLHGGGLRVVPRIPSIGSLSTISEESESHEFIVEPELTITPSNFTPTSGARGQRLSFSGSLDNVFNTSITVETAVRVRYGGSVQPKPVAIPQLPEPTGSSDCVNKLTT